MISTVVRDQGADTGNRVIDVLRKLIAHIGADFVIALAIKTVCGSKAAKIGHRFDIPYEDVWHAICFCLIDGRRKGSLFGKCWGMFFSF
jgi:hypothetical protein